MRHTIGALVTGVQTCALPICCLPCRSCGGCASVTAVSGCRLRKTRLVKGSTVTIPDPLPTQTGEAIQARNERHLGAMGAFVGAFLGRKLAHYPRFPDADGNWRQENGRASCRARVCQDG